MTEPKTSPEKQKLQGAMVRRYRQRMEPKMSQKDLGAATGYSRPTISNIERGFHKITHRTKNALNRALLIPAEEWTEIDERLHEPE